MSVFIGLDIGGTKFLVGAADGEGHILRRTRAATSTDLKQDLETLHWPQLTSNRTWKPCTG